MRKTPTKPNTRAIALAVCFVSTLILPQTSSAYSKQLVKLLERDDHQGAYYWLSQNESRYAHDPSFNEWLAQLAILHFRYVHAINALERLILLQPNNMGARLDLIVANFKAGYIDQAKSLLEQFESDIAKLDFVPESVLATTASLNKELQAAPTQYKWKGMFQLGAGSDSNANLGATDSIVTLNIFGEFPYLIELGDESVASSDQFTSGRLQLAVEEMPGNCYFVDWCTSIISDLSVRKHLTHDQYDQQQLLFGAFLTKRKKQRITQILTYFQQADLNDTDSQTSLALEFNQRLRRPSRWVGYALRLDYSHEAGSSLPDRQQLSATLFSDEDSDWRYSWNLAYYRQPDRAAGNTFRTRAGVSYKQVVSDILLRASTLVTLEQDTAAYSPLLFGSLKRRDISYLVTGSATYKFNNEWAASLRARYNFNKSTIPLFDRDRAELMLQLTYIW